MTGKLQDIGNPFQRVEMHAEYQNFLDEHGLSERDVLPLIKNRKKMLSPEMVKAIADLLVSLPNAKDEGELARAVQLLDGTLPDKNTNWLIRHVDNTYRQGLKEAQITPPDTVLSVGVFPLESFNARAVPRKNGTIILIDSGCMELLEFCSALSACFKQGRERELGEEYARGILRYVETRELPSLWDRLDRSEWERHGTVAVHTTNWAEWFVIAHEYGHHMLGHLSNARQETLEAGPSEISLNRYEHALEYEADIWALWSLLKVARSTSPDDEYLRAFACGAPFFFLATLAILENIWNKNGYRPESHPPATNRILNLESSLSRWSLLNDNAFFWANFSQIADVASDIISGHSLIPENPDMELLSAISTRSLYLQKRLPL